MTLPACPPVLALDHEPTLYDVRPVTTGMLERVHHFESVQKRRRPFDDCRALSSRPARAPGLPLTLELDPAAGVNPPVRHGINGRPDGLAR
jgi:hypothetical protein